MVIDDFFENLEFYISKNGFNKSSFAKAINVKQSTVSNWFARKTIPAEHLDIISDVLKIEPSELFERDAGSAYRAELKSLLEKYPSIGNKENPERWVKVRDLNQRYEYIGGYDESEYWKMFGRILPGIAPMVVELLQMVKVTNDNEKAFYSVCFLLMELAGERGKSSNFNEMIANNLSKKFIEAKKEQFIELANRIAGIEHNSALIEKIQTLSPIEQELILSAVDNLIKDKKDKKSVS